MTKADGTIAAKHLSRVSRQKPHNINTIFSHRTWTKIDALAERENCARTDVIRAAVDAFFEQLQQEESNNA